jgi:hypothetical protein
LQRERGGGERRREIGPRKWKSCPIFARGERERKGGREGGRGEEGERCGFTESAVERELSDEHSVRWREEENEWALPFEKCDCLVYDGAFKTYHSPFSQSVVRRER